jgi:hypothetical protein
MGTKCGWRKSVQKQKSTLNNYRIDFFCTPNGQKLQPVQRLFEMYYHLGKNGS